MTWLRLRHWRIKLRDLLFPRVYNRNELIKLLRQDVQDGLLESDDLEMIESVLQFSKMQARDIMVPRNQMVSVTIGQVWDELLNTVRQSGHSRFPVYAKSPDKVFGILHAKSLLKYHSDADGAVLLEEMLRPAVCIPESKHLNILLKEFRTTRNHMAIVVDEYGGVMGLLTIEDILEQIVGDIGDEFDIDEAMLVKKYSDREYIVKAHMSLDEFNDYFSSQFTDNSIDTIGGFVLQQFSYLPKRGELLQVDGYGFTVLHVANRRIKLLKLLIPETTDA